MSLPLPRRAFTLIELLIVVAIIAILAAIAVPNFLEAQTRARVSRAQSDMRTMATGLESYRVDHNAYPKGNAFGLGVYFPAASGGVGPVAGRVLERLSTPIAYLSASLLADPFQPRERTGVINPSDGSIQGPFNLPADQLEAAQYYKYYAGDPDAPGQFGLLALVDRPETTARTWWIVNSVGPDQIYPNMGGLFRTDATSAAIANHVYDPTNGTISFGSIFRMGGTTTAGDRYGGPFVSQISQFQN